MKPSDVTVEMGLKAFSETGLRPENGISFDNARPPGEPPCGCLIGALALQANPELRKRGFFDTETAVDAAFGPRYLKSGWNLVLGFDLGFTGSQPTSTSKVQKVGYAIGKALRPER